MLNGFFISYFTEPTGKGRFLPIVLLANSIHPPIPRLPLRPPLRSASGRRGYGGWIGSLKTWVNTGDLIHNNIIMITISRSNVTYQILDVTVN